MTITNVVRREKRQRERNKIQKVKKTSDAQHNCSLLADRCPASSQAVASGSFPSSLHADHDVLWYGAALESGGVSCPGCAPSQLLVPPSLLTGDVR